MTDFAQDPLDAGDQAVLDSIATVYTAVPPLTGIADDAGRFVFDAVPYGPAQPRIHPPAGSAARYVVTPSFEL